MSIKQTMTSVALVCAFGVGTGVAWDQAMRIGSADANAGGIAATAQKQEATAASGATQAYDAPVELDINFVFHIDDNLPEQDVFIEREPGSGKVYRATKGDQNLKAPLYAAAKPLKHAPFDAAAVGPWPKGRGLGLTLGEWFEAEGKGKYRCTDGQGHIAVEFNGLVPNGVYTMWHYFMAWPPTEPFIGTYDLPLGSRDGAQSVFTADAKGKARFERSFKPCLQLTGEHLAAGLAVAWHSDGKTYGVEPGAFATNSHIQLYTGLPKRSGI